MREGFSDRLDVSTYADDEPVHVFRCDKTVDAPDSDLWIPETVWHRLRHLGAAYGLHLLPLLDGTTDPVFLNGVQVEQLLGELRFVAEVVNDPAIGSQVIALHALANQRSDGTSRDMFGIEFP